MLLANLNAAETAMEVRMTRLSQRIESHLFAPPQATDRERVAKVAFAVALTPAVNLVVIPVANWLPVFSKLSHALTMVILTNATALAFVSATILMLWTSLATLSGLLVVLSWAAGESNGFLPALKAYLHELWTTEGCRAMTARHPMWVVFSSLPLANWLASMILGVEPVIIGTLPTMFVMVAPVVILLANLLRYRQRHK